jgi:C4-dicarboxylate-specific signal transduction histidine kinase
VRARIRLLLLLHAAAIAAAAGAVLVAAGAPLLARGALGPRAFALLAAAAVATALAVGALVLFRGVARPLDRLLGAAERLGGSAGAELPPLGPPGEGGSGLSRAALAFERLAAALGEERARLAAKVAELAATNRRLEAAREDLLRAERLATVGRLASGIAHEVGNPLGAIAGYAELARTRLRDGRGGAEIDEYLARIGADAGRIDAIVRDLLDFARPAPPALSAVDVAAALDAAVRLARVQPRFRDVEVEVALGDGRVRVVADERRLSQVFLNLLLNAGDAMAGRGRVRVSARALGAGDPPRVEIEVADSGPGIAPEHLPRVFDPFFTTKEPGQGTGLGLAVCHGIVSSFGGTLSAANVPGAGAALRLELRSCADERPRPPC